MVIVNTENNSLVSGSTGADSIINYANYVTIDALGGNDTIKSAEEAYKMSINGGAGNDAIYQRWCR